MKKIFQAVVALQIRIPLVIREKLEARKEKTGKSVNQIINEILEEYLRDET